MNKHFSNAYNIDQSNYIKKPLTRLLFIDSRDRINGNPFNFTIKLTETIGIEPYKNIEKIVLKNVGIPKIKDEHYVILDIPDFFDYLDSTDNIGSHRSSCILYYNDTEQQIASVKQNQEDHIFTFNPKLSAINNFNVKIHKYGGKSITKDDFNFTNDIDFNNLFTTFLFEITYLP